MVLTAELDVPLEEAPALRGPAEPLEVHREERHVEQDVLEPVAVVELEAVEDPRPVGEAEDVLGQQVAVPVADHAGGDALVEEGLTAGEVPLREPPDLRELPRGDELRDAADDRVEVVPPVAAHGVARGHGRDVRTGDGGLDRRVQGRDAPGDGTQTVAHVLAALEEGAQPALVRHAAHGDEVVGDLALGVEHVEDPQVHVGRQSAVQRDLPTAGVLARLPGGEVQEAERHGLLELVGPIAHEEDGGTVRLGHRGGQGHGFRRPVPRSVCVGRSGQLCGDGHLGAPLRSHLRTHGSGGRRPPPGSGGPEPAAAGPFPARRSTGPWPPEHSRPVHSSSRNVYHGLPDVKA